MLRDKKIHWNNLVTLSGAAILVGTELIGVSWAAGWALGGLLQLPPAYSLMVEFMGGGIGLMLVISFVKAAVKNEPIYH